MVKRIYFIGSDMNQFSLIKDTGSRVFTELHYLRMDMLQGVKLDQIFLRDNNQLTQYSKKDFEFLNYNNMADLSGKSKAEQYEFTHELEDKLIISNGNMNGVLVIMELGIQDFFRSSLPDVYSDVYQFSIQNMKNELIWSSTAASKSRQQPYQPSCQKCIKMEKELNPYPYRIIFSKPRFCPLF